MAIINKTIINDDNFWRAWNPQTLLVGVKNGKLLWKIVWQFFKMVNIQLLYNTTIPLPTIYPKMKTCVQMQVCKQMFTAALFTIAKSENHSNAEL